MKPVVSIVIPTYNRVRDLERALKSVFAQTYSDWEALVVDNHSSDNTDDLIKSCNDSRINLFKIHNNGVIAASRNLGIQHANGEYVAFLDSDDWWAPQKLEKSLKHLDAGADVVYHDLFLMTKHRQKLLWQKTRTRVLKNPVFEDLIINGNALNTSSVVLRRSILEDINGFAEDRGLIGSEDYDVWLRTAKITEEFVRIPRTLGYYWAGDGNFWAGGKDGTSFERIIAGLDYLVSIYTEDFSKLKGTAYWIDYAKANAYYNMGSYSMAKKHAKLIHCGRAPFHIHFGAHLILLLINIHFKSKNWKARDFSR